MAVAIATTVDVPAIAVDVTLTGLVVGTQYDVFRLNHRYTGNDPDTGTPQYEQELPDRKAFWRAVGHRIGWTAPAATATFRDYEAPLRPYRYFVVETSLVSPHEYNWQSGNYPLSRGVLGGTVVHFAKLIAALEGPEAPGHIMFRSTDELALFKTFCVVEATDLRYTARGTELPVIGQPYPVYIADTREARRGSLVVMAHDLGEYDSLRRIVFPVSGQIRPVIMNAGGDPVMLLDDMVVVPLDVSIEQATPSNADKRYVRFDYVEVDPTAPLYKRSGDNDLLTTAPHADFTIAPTVTPLANQTVTFTNTSTGTYQSREWTFQTPNSNSIGKSFTNGPQKIRWGTKGKKTIKLRVYGTDGASTITKTITVR
jgi:hypothetical protein